MSTHKCVDFGCLNAVIAFLLKYEKERTQIPFCSILGFAILLSNNGGSFSVGKSKLQASISHVIRRPYTMSKRVLEIFIIFQFGAPAQGPFHFLVHIGHIITNII